MSEKKYSIEHVQTIVDLGPSELQKLIKKNSRHLNIIRENNKDGKKEMFLDEKSLQKLLFIARLSRSDNKPNVDSALAQLKEPALRLKGVSDDVEEDFVTKMNRVFDAVTNEAGSLQQNLDQLLIKYDHLIKELNLARAKNIILEKEISTLRNREAHLMGQLRQDAENLDEDDLDLSLIN